MNDVDWLDDHTFAAPTGQLLPPGCCGSLTALVSEFNDGRGCCAKCRWVDLGEASENIHVPDVVGEGVDPAFSGKDLERSQAEVVDGLDGPAILPIGLDEALR